ncbi:MAG: transposase [Muribaculaceae bacterium]|nr:transposase [Muribaculaceae bacterium]
MKNFSKKNYRHHHNRRKRGHDYCAPKWKYHITIAKNPDCNSFGSLVIEELTTYGVKVKYSALGNIIWRGIRAFQLSYFEVYRYAIMPDHIHLLIYVKERLPMHLSRFIAKFKTEIANEWRRRQANPELKVFERGFNDRIIMKEQNLNMVYEYIHQNPYRLAVRQCRPHFFQKIRHIFIDNREIQAYGNLFHFRNPFKYVLIVHRNDNDEIFNQKLQECIYFALNGGVVVSAFISQREKKIRKEIEAVGGRIILVNSRPFEERGKPAKHDFELCIEGRLLVVSPIDYFDYPKSDHPSRSQCLNMNALAERIAENPEIIRR